MTIRQICEEEPKGTKSPETRIKYAKKGLRKPANALQKRCRMKFLSDWSRKRSPSLRRIAKTDGNFEIDEIGRL